MATRLSVPSCTTGTDMYVRPALRLLMAQRPPSQVLEGGPGVPWRQLAMYALQSETQRLQARALSIVMSPFAIFRRQHVLCGLECSRCCCLACMKPAPWLHGSPALTGSTLVHAFWRIVSKLTCLNAVPVPELKC